MDLAGRAWWRRFGPALVAVAFGPAAVLALLASLASAAVPSGFTGPPT